MTKSTELRQLGNYITVDESNDKVTFNSDLNITNTVDSDFQIKVTGVGATDKYTLLGPSTSTDLRLGVANDAKLTIKGDGNVGIGTSSPESKLHILGPSTGSSDGSQTLTVGNTTGGTKLAVGTSENSHSWIRSYESGVGGRELYLQPDPDGKVTLGNSSSPGKLRIDSTVGANTNSIGGTLMLWDSTSGVAGAGPTITFSHNWNATGTYLDGAPFIKGYKVDGSTSNYNSGLKFGTRTNGIGAATVAMTIDHNQNVGIGTDSPSAKLDVQDSGVTNNAWNTLAKFRPDLSDGPAEASIHIQSYPSTTIVNDRKAGIQSVNDAGTVVPLIINKDGGNVGIGVTSPESKLHIREDSARLILSNVTPNLGDASSILLAEAETLFGAGIKYNGSSNEGKLFGRQSGIEQDVLTWKRDASLAYFSTNVGIGTGAPGKKLHVNGSALFTADGSTTSRSINGVGISYTNDSAYAENVDIGDANRYFAVTNDSTTENDYAAVSMRVNPNGLNGFANAMMDMKLVSQANDASKLVFTMRNDQTAVFKDALEISHRNDLTIGRGGALVRKSRNSEVSLYGITSHIINVGAGSSGANVRIMRVKRGWWGAGNFEIRVRGTYYSGSDDGNFQLEGHSSIQYTGTMFATMVYGDTPSRIYLSARQSDFPADANTGYQDVYITVPAYFSYVIEILTSRSDWVQNDTELSTFSNGYYIA